MNALSVGLLFSGQGARSRDSYRRTPMRASTATLRQILLDCLLMGVCAPVWARFEPVSCKNRFTEQQEIAGGSKLAAQAYQQMPIHADRAPVSEYVRQLG